MITTINEFRKINEENLLIPRRLDDRALRKKQNNLRMLQQEIIDGDLTIDKSFEDFTKEQIKFKQINGNITLKELYSIPEWLSEVIVNGFFNCYNNNLTTLKNCPQTVKNGFYCSSNKLTSLKGCPLIDNGDFICSYNQLISLEYCPQIVNGEFSCNNNNLTSLKRGPQTVKNGFDCSHNELISLEHCPHNIKGDFYCSDNKVQFTIEQVKELCYTSGHIKL